MPFDKIGRHLPWIFHTPSVFPEAINAIATGR
jgi:hypothetical protein